MPDAARALRCARSGAALTELLAGMTLAALAATLVGGLLTAQLRLARHVTARAASADAVRLTLAVLGGETRRATPGDIRAAAADSIALRSFRGMGIACGEHDGLLHVRYRGDRLPDPRKDSVLLVRGASEEHALALLDTRTGTASDCMPRPGEEVLRWQLSAPPDNTGGVILVFESGSYYLASRALRYRLGAEGRQPLTAELFEHPASRFGDPGPAGVPLHLRTTRGDRVPGLASFAPPAW
jgi:hypothetical protein